MELNPRLSPNIQILRKLKSHGSGSKSDNCGKSFSVGQLVPQWEASRITNLPVRFYDNQQRRIPKKVKKGMQLTRSWHNPNVRKHYSYSQEDLNTILGLKPTTRTLMEAMRDRMSDIFICDLVSKYSDRFECDWHDDNLDSAGIECVKLPRETRNAASPSTPVCCVPRPELFRMLPLAMQTYCDEDKPHQIHNTLKVYLSLRNPSCIPAIVPNTERCAKPLKLCTRWLNSFEKESAMTNSTECTISNSQSYCQNVHNTDSDIDNLSSKFDMTLASTNNCLLRCSDDNLPNEGKRCVKCRPRLRKMNYVKVEYTELNTDTEESAGHVVPCPVNILCGRGIHLGDCGLRVEPACRCITKCKCKRF